MMEQPAEIDRDEAGRKERPWLVVWHGKLGKTPRLLTASVKRRGGRALALVSESVVRLVAWEIGCRPIELRWLMKP
jgi:hypothetical protein